jgi:DNA-binding MarR family transcriptional regulator
MKDIRSSYNTCLYHSNAALHRSLARSATEHFRPLDLSPTQGFILMTLKSAPGITVGDLALVHQLDTTTISRTLDRMEAKRLVKRDGTGRAVRVFITTKGLKLEADAQAAWRRLRLYYNDLLGEPQAHQLADTVTRAKAVLEGEQ